ncbi:MAG: cysteine synthase family protein [Bacilli bacterium]|nr:cysteine synthase family protein [Bacilli bacterium]
MDIKKLIGNTPIIKIKIDFKGKIKNIYAKLEYYNYTGSIKDRLAYYIINESYKKGDLKKGMPIIEVTSGNTGISFSALGALYNHPVHIFIPDWASEERIKIMKLYGAQVHLVSKEEGGFNEAIRRADDLAKKIDGFRPNQFLNIMNVLAHYKGTGEEIVTKLSNINAFVSGIGTGGTLIGVAKKIKENYPEAKVIALEPENMTLLSKEKKIGMHKIEGIGDDFLPDLVDKTLIDKVITISDDEAINMTKRLASELGLGVGISSGANFLASVLTEEDNVVTIFADDMKKYLSTDLTIENESKDYISNEVKFINIDVL